MTGNQYREGYTTLVNTFLNEIEHEIEHTEIDR